jgi:hypothetical protein
MLGRKGHWELLLIREIKLNLKLMFIILPPFLFQFGQFALGQQSLMASNSFVAVPVVDDIRHWGPLAGEFVEDYGKWTSFAHQLCHRRKLMCHQFCAADFGDIWPEHS